ncbi:hypothetical protein ACLOJK_034918, partial [Asimina triloba]
DNEKHFLPKPHLAIKSDEPNCFVVVAGKAWIDRSRPPTSPAMQARDNHRQLPSPSTPPAVARHHIRPTPATTPLACHDSAQSRFDSLPPSTMPVRLPLLFHPTATIIRSKLAAMLAHRRGCGMITTAHTDNRPRAALKTPSSLQCR